MSIKSVMLTVAGSLSLWQALGWYPSHASIPAIFIVASADCCCPFTGEDTQAWSLQVSQGGSGRQVGVPKSDSVDSFPPTPSPPLKVVMMVTLFNLTLTIDLRWRLTLYSWRK